MKRKLRSVGILAAGHLHGDRIDSPMRRAIYDALRGVGFRETPWQLIYEGQIGGLVLPYQDGHNEIHIRFYADRVFAELEVGRAYVSHFVGPRFNANDIVLHLLDGRAPTQIIRELTMLMSTEHQKDDERILLPAVDGGPDPLACLIDRSPRRFLATLTRTGWGPIYGLSALVTSGAALASGATNLLGSVVLATCLLVGLAAVPTVGKP